MAPVEREKRRSAPVEPPGAEEPAFAGEGEDGATPGDGGPPAAIIEVTYTVEPNYAGWRLDRYLCQKIRRASRTRVQRFIERDLVSERPLKASTPVWPGLTFTLRRRVREEPSVPELERLTELYVDDWLLVLDKPAGLPVHPTARYCHNTLVAQLAQRYGPGFADPAHRLDRETSGVVVCGRSLAASQRLTRAFRDGAVSKEYLAIVEGRPPPEQEVEAPIAEGTEEVRIAVRIDHAVGRYARTTFRVEHRFERDGAHFALVRCQPHTGRQHQIRIHAKVAGFPLVGDKIYGPDPGYFDRFSKRCLEDSAWERLRLPRHALHAATLTLPHPGSGRQVTFTAPVPSDLADFIAGR